jgi:hypothetical protein
LENDSTIIMMIKVSIVCALLGVASCAVIAPAIVGTGASAQFRSQDVSSNTAPFSSLITFSHMSA